ncbi:hypothetical protein [Penaeicola halotolerans]|uniref:hypothetical protein n=1 Tax=Penaeicola halotolerans TaxID=2793196 RepID=UPI001CF9058B|nr:hypothetical protein [Penaeicola halotolerans]
MKTLVFSQKNMCALVALALALLVVLSASSCSPTAKEYADADQVSVTNDTVEDDILVTDLFDKKLSMTTIFILDEKNEIIRTYQVEDIENIQDESINQDIASSAHLMTDRRSVFYKKDA